MMAQHSMNSTPKDRVKAVYPDAVAKKGRLQWVVRSGGVELGVGMNVFDAWMDAASKLKGVNYGRQIQSAGADDQHDTAADQRNGAALPAGKPATEQREE